MCLSLRFGLIGYITIIILSVIQQCYSTSVHHFLSDYEVLTYETTKLAERHKRTRHSAPNPEIVEHTGLHIQAFGKNLTLLLTHDYDVVHPTARLTIGGVDHPRGLSGFVDHTVRGIAANYPNSMVFGSILNGVFRGTIVLDHSHSDMKLIMLSDSYFIEPAGYYFEEITEFHSIIYHASHVRKPEQHFKSYSERFDNPSHFCGLSNPEIVRKMESLTIPVSDMPKNEHRRVKRNAGSPPSDPIAVPLPNVPTDSRSPNHFAYSQPTMAKAAIPKKRVCNLFLQSDTFLWDRVMKLKHIQGDKDLAAKEITSILTQHVQSAQTIFENHVFRDHSGKLEYSGIGFRVDHVAINMTDVHCKPRPGSNSIGSQAKAQSQPVEPGSPPSLETYADENPFCSKNIDVTNLLNLFSYGNYDAFCAAYLFTFLDFSGGTLGLAFVAGSNRAGGVCSKHGKVLEGTQPVYKSLNTGLVTLVNYGKPVPTQVSQVTFAHELGHNFGCNHDDDYKTEPYGCLPELDDPKGNYIMFSSATNGDKQNNNKFSRCSSNSIALFLQYLTTVKTNCFVDSEGPFCGNKLIEAGEECDCGFTVNSCKDRCCNARESKSPCKLTDYITIGGSRQKVRCSMSSGECCTHECQFQSTKHMCRSPTECYGASYCTGQSAKCPPPNLLPDGTLCQDSTRVCKKGQCVGSLCERIPGWIECFTPRSEAITPEMMCYVSCRQNKSNSSCINTLMLQQNKALQSQYPDLTSRLLHKGSAIRMQPGTPCDNYLGYCDAFHRCMSVEARGPLARLRNLLFSPQVMEQAKSWVTIHWWAVILMCLGAIIGMILFVKLCARHTPMAQSRYPHRARSVVNINRNLKGPTQPIRAKANPGSSALPKERRSRPNHQKRTKSRRPVTSSVVPSAPHFELDDLALPPNARQKPLPIINNSNVTLLVHPANCETKPISVVATAAPLSSSARTDSNVIIALPDNSRTARSNSGVRGNSQNPRPVSMFVRTSNIVSPGPFQFTDHNRRRSKLQQPVSSRSVLQQPLLVPHSTSTVINEAIPKEDRVFLPSSALIPIQTSSHAPQLVRHSTANTTDESVQRGVRRNQEKAITVAVDLNVPPPAYEDLPLHKPVLHRHRSSPSKCV